MDTFLDIRTLSFISGLISVILAAVMLITLKMSKTYPGFPEMAAAFLFNAVGNTLISFRGTIPDSFTVIIANCSITLWAVLINRGLSLFFGKKPMTSVHALFVAVQLVSFLFFTYLQPNVPVRIVIVSALISLLFLSSTTILLKHQKQLLGQWQVILFSALSLMALWFAVRTAITLISHPTIVNFLKAGSYQATTFIIIVVGATVSVFGLILMNTRRLILDLEQSHLKINTLSQLIPICSNCHKVRSDNGYWEQVESYISSHTSSEFSHGICPECVKKIYPELTEEILKSTPN